ncbi:hypothetical protein M413DRAFT_447909, partial [Hebeloma cylindrosporum]
MEPNFHGFISVIRTLVPVFSHTDGIDHAERNGCGLGQRHCNGSLVGLTSLHRHM